MNNNSFKFLIAVLGLVGSIISIANGNVTIFIIVSTSILIYATCIILYNFNLKRKYKKNHELILHGKHPGFYSALDLLKNDENRDIRINKLIKNIRYTDNNKTSNVTYIINGIVNENFSKGLHLVISAGSLISNITTIGYAIITEPNQMIEDENFHFIDNLKHEKLVKFKSSFEDANKNTPYSKKIFLPFITPLSKKDTFQAIFYYTWENSIIDTTDSTSYHTSNLFPNGVDILKTNLSFTKKPYQIFVSKVEKNKKYVVSDVKKIYNDKDNNNYIINWETSNPKGTFILQRTL